jgi:adenosylmethionine-8-amino-7-oxononanoate aminotransferase
MQNSKSDIYHRDPSTPPPLARAGRNHFIITNEEYSLCPVVDLSCGAAVTGLGLSDRVVKGAMSDQLYDLPYVHSAQFTAPAIEAAGHAVMSSLEVKHADGSKWMPFEGGAVTFFSGGAEAIEAAVKMAMQYQSNIVPEGNPIAIVGRRHSYHGYSMFTLALGDHPRKKALYAAWNMTPHIERIEAYAPNLFADGFLNEDEERAHCAVALRSLERVLQLHATHKRRCIVVIETVGGTTVSIAPPSVAYLVGVRKLCNEFEATLIYDEILCANYRTGYLTAWQHYQSRAAFDIAPDIFVMGKGITAGYFPMSAVVVNKAIREIGEQEKKVWHTSTNQNHVVGCAALCAAFQRYHLMVWRINTLSEYMEQTIAPALREIEGVRAVSGVGMLWGVQFNPRVKDLHLTVKKELFKLGYSVYSDGATIDGLGNMILLAPSYIMNEVDLDGAVNAITKATNSSYDQHL